MSAFKEHSHIGASDARFGSISCDDQEAPRRRSARASQRITALGEMTTGLAHDFRNILAVISSAISLAERNAENKAKLRAALDGAREGIGRGTALITKLILFAKPRPHDVHAEDVNELLRNLKLFLDYGAGPDIRVRLQLAPALPPCRIDAAQFGAAILNLVVNARDAMRDGGEIRVATDLISLSETNDANLDPKSVLVRIIDQGEGIPKNVRDRIFDPYFTTKGESGTGLGVPQVAAFMRASGGCMNVSSEAGVGTSFDLYFPICDSPGLVGTNLWRQLDRWGNEGGRTASPAPRFGH
jgi:signal transduction histidine kinase